MVSYVLGKEGSVRPLLRVLDVHEIARDSEDVAIWVRIGERVVARLAT